MTPARSNRNRQERHRETAEATGCLSGFLLPPMAAFIAGLAFLLLLTSLRPETNIPVQAAAASFNVNEISPTVQPRSTAGLSPIFTPEVQWWGPQILLWSAEYGLDPNLVATVMQIESCGDPKARSSAGASGLFQVMPFHFYVVENPYDPDTNAKRGLGYLKRSLEAAGGNTTLALAGYNGGIGVISRSQAAWAEETRRYIYWGSGIYADASAGATVSARMEEWKARASGVCRNARLHLGL
jgi:soluble lytic murein transglycosylase-like protein